MQETTPRGLRLHIGILGRRNAGKSSLLNALTLQQVAIVSDQAGTTTDPVYKPMELFPLGPVLFIDTAGNDDEGTVGQLRVEKTFRILERLDVALLVADASVWGEPEEQILYELVRRKIPHIVVVNKVDLAQPEQELLDRLERRQVPWVQVSAARGTGLDALREALVSVAPEDFLSSPPLLEDVVAPGEIVVLVVPVDQEAPKGRLILPQVQVIRNLLDHGRLCVVVRDTELPQAFAALQSPPRLVVTDSQAFAQVAAVTPPEVALTSFSILFARFKGDLSELVRGAEAIDSLRPGDSVLIAEACSHHPIKDDIGREKIPRWLQERVGGPLEFRHVKGHDFPADVKPYRLVIQCGACMSNRRQVLNRIAHCRSEGVPISNYGLVIANLMNILGRALAPFRSTPELGQ